MVLAFLLSSTLVCFAVKKETVAPPQFGGTWKLDPIHSTVNIKDMQASTVVITPFGDKLEFDFLGGEKLIGRETYTLDGVTHDSYTGRQVNRSFISAWMNKKSELIVRTRNILDLDDTQEYTDTDTWSVSPDGKTLTDRMTDGKLLIYQKQPSQAEAAKPAKP